MSTLLPNIGPIKFYPATYPHAEECNQTKIQGIHTRERAGSRRSGILLFNTRGLQIPGQWQGVRRHRREPGRRVVPSSSAARPVVVATGGFALQQEMLNDLMPDIRTT